MLEVSMSTENKKKESQEFKPYIPAEKEMPELTATSIITGLLLAVIFGAANAYLGLKVGLTISASIPAAVISMGIMRGILKRGSILENNLVQTIGSAGESLAAGCIFIMPVLFLWSREGTAELPGLLTLSAIALCGGILGCIFMIPLRNMLIVKEHDTIPYPEGTACAKVLLAGEQSVGSSAKVFIGMAAGAVSKFIVDGLNLVSTSVSVKINSLKTAFSFQVSSALLGVGYICGPQIASRMFSGGIIAWFVLIPLINIFGADTIMFPADVSVASLYESGGASAIWSSYIKYIGAGAVASAGIISMCKSLPLIANTLTQSLKGLKGAGTSSRCRTERDLGPAWLITALIVCILLMLLVPGIPINWLAMVIIFILGFIFAVVSARICGIVGSSNSPISGMTIATLLIVTPIFKALGINGSEGMQISITVGAVICIIAAMSGDMSQDLKTGYLVGSTPAKQQFGELLGVLVTAASIGGVMVLLDKAWGFGSPELSAPQAVLMKTIVEGIMNGNLPWGLIFIGVALAVVIEILGIPALTVCIGIYLPLELTSTIMIGGLLRLISDKINGSESESSDGILFSSGLVAGEGLIGILLAVLTVCGADISLSGLSIGGAGTIILTVILSASILLASYQKKKKI